MTYNAKEIEQKYYSIWEERGYFELDSNKHISNGKNFSIMMPPPNITGALHMGHALTYTLQDIITRYKRMQGFRTLWQPGIDHAGIATQNVVERQLLARGIKKEEIGREAFLKEVWKWKEESGSTILSQLKTLGASANWKRARFTMDKGLQNAVKKAFVSWYDRGLIVQGNYMINWCTHDGALSDIEVEYEENQGRLYYIRYYLADTSEHSSLGNHFIDLLDFRELTDSSLVNPLKSSKNSKSTTANIRMLEGGSGMESVESNLDSGVDSALDSSFSKDSNSLDSTQSVESSKINPHEVRTLRACSGEEGQNDKNMTKGEKGRRFAQVEPPFPPLKNDGVENDDLMGDFKGIEDSPLDSTNLKDSTNPLESSKDSAPYIIVATTRPETFFGDTAVMVNPNDERYKHLIGKKVVLPLINKEIEIIADSHVDMEFGSGAVKVTPAHDTNDYEVGKRHNLEFITIFDKHGILNSHCGEFEGLERLEARDKIVAKLEQNGFIEKIEDYKNQIGKCYRCGNIVEPYISKQWFVKKEIAKNAILKVNEGEARFYPPQWINNFNAWMNDLRDWCISRQLWWGHRIPVFYCDSCGTKLASINEAESCPKCSKTMRQDEDVLDTWFSSGLWAFSTLGWGNTSPNDSLEQTREIESLYNKSDLEDFFPNSLLITSFDILFFWVARMLFSSDSELDKIAFRDIYLHALVCDEFGQKMSKSKGNVINPLEIINEYSSDILRFSLAYNCIQGRSIRISKKTLDIGNALALKVQNALNFLLMYKEQQNGEFIEFSKISSPLGRYMKGRFSECVREVTSSLDSYRFNDASGAIYRFLFNDFCDYGIELVKAQKSAVFELGAILKEAMKLLHPFMPFLSEFVFQAINGTKLEDSTSIMIAKFPEYEEYEREEDFSIIRDIITSIRRAKVVIELANKSIPLSYVKLNAKLDKELAQIFIPKLSKCEEVKFVDSKVENCILDIGEFCEIYIPKENLNLDELATKLEKKKSKIMLEISKLDSMLGNEKFIKNAPKELVESNSLALNEAKEKLEKIENELETLRK